MAGARTRVVLWLTLTCLSCQSELGDEHQTGVLIVIDAEETVRELASTLRVQIEVDDPEAPDGRMTRFDEKTPKPVTFPKRIALVPKGGDASRVFTLTATALDDRGRFVSEARIITGYVENELRSTRLLIEGNDCLRKVCDERNTCRSGLCENAEVPPENLNPGLDASIDPVTPPEGGRPEKPDAGPAPECTNGEHACSSDLRSARMCEEGTWATTACGGAKRCNDEPGPTRGTCQDVAIPCTQSSCSDAGPDAGSASGAPPIDAGFDAGPSAPIDAGMDAGSDAGIDAGFDAGIDAGIDAGFDAGIDAGSDAGIDAGRDGGIDAGFDAGLETPGRCATWTVAAPFGSIPATAPIEAGHTTSDRTGRLNQYICRVTTPDGSQTPAKVSSNPGNAAVFDFTCYAAYQDASATWREYGDESSNFEVLTPPSACVLDWVSVPAGGALPARALPIGRSSAGAPLYSCRIPVNLTSGGVTRMGTHVGRVSATAGEPCHVQYYGGVQQSAAFDVLVQTRP